jgi:hypothetical protein
MIVTFLVLVIVIGGAILGRKAFLDRDASKNKTYHSSLKKSSLKPSKKNSSSKEKSSVSTSESFAPTDEQKEDVKNVEEIGDEEIAKGREELKAAGYNPTDFSKVDMARYIKKAKDDKKGLVDIVKSDGVEP